MGDGSERDPDSGVGRERGTTIGDVDPARVQELIDLALPILQDRGADVDATITADGLATNQFIDTSVVVD